METVYDIIKRMESDEKNGVTQISEYVSFNLRETIETVDAYLNSKHISGSTDANGLDKPFFNICISAANIWFRATDIDRKDIRIKATKSDQYVTSFIATILLQEWMRKNNFGMWLNEWGRTLARYGSAVSKFVKKDGTLVAEVIPWNRILCDSVDFESNIKIEKHWFTKAQIKKNPLYDKELVKKLCEATVARETMGGQKKDNKDDYILVYEVHGEMPLSYLTDDPEDDDEFVQQMHLVSFQNTNSKEVIANTLYRGREKKNPYHIAHLIKEDGRTLAIGAVEHAFDAQWMTNHSVKLTKDQLDLASKLLFQTADGNYVGKNALTNLQNGDILITAPDAPLTQLNNRPDIAAMQSFGQQWQALANQINGISEAMTGANPPSGTAWRLQNAILQESHSLFELMTENKGLQIVEILREHVIPVLKEKLNTSDEIAAILEEHQIKQLDEMYVPNEAIRQANKQIKETILKGEIFDPTTQGQAVASAEEALRNSLKTFGNQRFIKPADIETKTWKQVLEDIEWELQIDVTNEATDTQAVMQTLTTVLQSIASNPAILQDPNAKLLFNKILNHSGAINPIELQVLSQPAQPTPQMQTAVTPA